jgi:hypothetical protein
VIRGIINNSDTIFRKNTKTMVKLSTAIMQVAISGFRNPNETPIESAAQYALFLAHIAWNTANNEPPTKELIEELRSNLMYKGKIPDIFQTKNEENLLKIMTNYKRKVFPNDKRIIEACGYINGKVQAYWKD